MAKVSIITAVLNGEKYISECIESVLAQSLSDIEYIIVDAGSTDGTIAIINEFTNTDSRIKLINSGVKSYGYQMNLGIKAASGEYIGVVEADDYIDSTMFEKLYRVANANNLDVLKSNYITFYGNKEKRSYISSQIVPADSLDLYGEIVNYNTDRRIFNTATVTWTGLYRRSFLLENSICHNESPGASFQDNGFWIQVMISAERLMFIDEAFYYLRRDNSDSSVFSDSKVDCLIHEYEFMRDRIIKRDVDTKFLLNCYWNKKFDAFGWDVTRNKYEYRLELVDKYASDFRNALESNEFFDDGVNTNAYREVVRLIADPKMYFDEKYRVPDEIIKAIDESNCVYIYGAGGYAARLYLRINGVMGSKFSGFVTTKNDEKNYFMDRPVQTIDSVKVNTNTIFIIGVSEKNRVDVQRILEDKKYNYLLYSI